VGRLPFGRENLSASPARGPRKERRPDWLVRAIETQIIPRLLMHAVSSRHGGGSCLERWTPTSDDISEFANLLIAHDAGIALAYVRAWRQQGAAMRTLYLELLAPAAAHLRRLRLQRRLGFARLLLARYRLVRVVRALRADRSEPEVTAAAD
jgi:hypothetical protein